jgi:transcriptional repressor NrdR
MKCPYCQDGEIKTLETRESQDNITRRRKECIKCKKRFTTYESIEDIPLMVIKKDGSLQLFDFDKILRGIKKAFEKREISDDILQEMARDVVEKIKEKNVKEIKSSKIGLYVINRIKKVDEVAYIRFASVYRGFEDLEHFEKEIIKLQKQEGA